MAHTWNHGRAADHIEKKIKDVKEVKIVSYVRDMSLANIPTNKAYRVDGVHLYADILNLTDMLNVTAVEGVDCHKKTLRFLDLHQRAVHRILQRCDALRVDFHNQRLHALITKPYNMPDDAKDDEEDDAEAQRVYRAVAIAQLIIDVLDQTGDTDESIPNAKVRVGIDSGETLAVNNGRNGGRESLFLGDAANQSAKLSGGGNAKGIFLTSTARTAIGLVKVEHPKNIAMTKAEIEVCQEEADLGVSSESIVKEWRADLAARPIGSFVFTRHTPPLRTIDITALTPGNSRRQEAVSIYADIDGFTAYVRRNIKDNAADVVRTFHVIRAELDRVLSVEFDGRRIRFIGDCLHGLTCDGTAHTTDETASVSSATLCAGGLRSSFELALEKLDESDVNITGLGLAVGFELGPMTVTRLGMQGSRVRTSVSRGTLVAEDEQKRCNGDETAIGPAAFKAGTDAVRKLFGPRRKTDGLDYNATVEGLAQAKDATALSSKETAFASSAPAVIRSTAVEVKPYAEPIR